MGECHNDGSFMHRYYRKACACFPPWPFETCWAPGPHVGGVRATIFVVADCVTLDETITWYGLHLNACPPEAEPNSSAACCVLASQPPALTRQLEQRFAEFDHGPFPG